MLLSYTLTLGLHTHTHTHNEWEYKRTAASRYEQNNPPAPRRDDHQPAVKPRHVAELHLLSSYYMSAGDLI